MKKNIMTLDFNLVDAPIFRFSKRLDITTAEELQASESVLSETKSILKKIPKANQNSDLLYRQWVNGKGEHLALLAASLFAYPDGYAMDVYLALIRMYIDRNNIDELRERLKKDEPISYKMKFSFYELCNYMKVSKDSRTYEKIRDAFQSLGAVKYHPVTGGVIKEKKENKIRDSYDLNGISLISDMSIKPAKKNPQKELSTITFGSVFIDNIINSFVRIIDTDEYLSVKSGLARRLYVYIKGHSVDYNSKKKLRYIKRSYGVLEKRLPIDSRYKSKTKEQLKRALSHLIKAELIKDYIFADDIPVNGEKEESLYILFKDTKEEFLKRYKESKKKKEKIALAINKADILIKNTEYYEPTKDQVREYLNSIEYSYTDIAIQNMSKNPNLKWRAIKLYHWFKDAMDAGNISNPGGLFHSFYTGAIPFQCKSTHPVLDKFITDGLNQELGQCMISEKEIDEKYSQYIEKKLKVKKKENDFVYAAIIEGFENELEVKQKIEIAKYKRLIEMNPDMKKSELERFEKTLNSWECVLQDGSEKYKELLTQYLVNAYGLKDRVLFKEQLLNELRERVKC